MSSSAYKGITKNSTEIYIYNLLLIYSNIIPVLAFFWFALFCSAYLNIFFTNLFNFSKLRQQQTILFRFLLSLTCYLHVFLFPFLVFQYIFQIRQSKLNAFTKVRKLVIAIALVKSCAMLHQGNKFRRCLHTNQKS